MTLAELKIGQDAVLRTIGGQGELRHHLLDMGLTPGTEVTLRKIAEALGYNVTWDYDTQSVTVDDDYIQKATLKNRSCEAVFEGHLKVINMSRTIENARETVVRDGYTYVPLEFFREFLNETIVENGVISVSPQMCELD